MRIHVGMIQRIANLWMKNLPSILFLIIRIIIFGLVMMNGRSRSICGTGHAGECGIFLGLCRRLVLQRHHHGCLQVDAVFSGGDAFFTCNRCWGNFYRFADFVRQPSIRRMHATQTARCLTVRLGCMYAVGSRTDYEYNTTWNMQVPAETLIL